MSTPASPSFRIVGGDGNQYGPVDLATLQQWAREGRLSGETQVWDSRTGCWQPAAQIAELAGILSAPPPSAPAPAAVATAAPAPGKELAAEVLQRGYAVDIGDWISQGWEFFKANLGFVLAVFWIVQGLDLIVELFGIIPCLGPLTKFVYYIVVQPVLFGGLWYVLLLRRRGQPVTVGNVFDGFKLFFGQCVVLTIVMGLIIAGVLIPGVVLVVIGGITVDSCAAIGVPLLILGLVAVLVPLMYLSVCYAFAMPLVVDRRMEFWPAMETSRRVVSKHWFAIFGFLIVTGLVGMAGAAACCFGLIFTLPLALCIPVVAYENIFNRPS